MVGWRELRGGFGNVLKIDFHGFFEKFCLPVRVKCDIIVA